MEEKNIIRTKYTKDLLEPLVLSSFSVGQVLDKLSLKRTGGNYRSINKYINAYEFDLSHFKGQGWSKGETKDSNASLRSTSKKLKIPDEKVFVENSTYNPSSLGKRLQEIGVEYICSFCHLDTWLGKPLTLHVDHINGNISDNRLENLRFLCPNCHQQTDTWGSKNQRKFSVKKPIVKKAREKKEIEPTGKCPVCTRNTFDTKYCSRQCSVKGNQKVDRPTKEQLELEIMELSWSALGRKYKVSDNAVRKWAKKYNLI